MKKLVCIAVLALGASVFAQQSSQSVDQAAREQRAQDQANGQRKVYTEDDFPSKPNLAPAEDKKADTATPDAAGGETGSQDATAAPATSDAKTDEAAPADATKKADTDGSKKTDATGDAEKKEAVQKDADSTTEAKPKKDKPAKELTESDTADKEKDKDANSAEKTQAKVDAEWKEKMDAQKAKIASLQREYDLTDREYKLFATTYYADAGNRLRDQKDFHDHETSYRDKLSTLKQQIADEQAKLGDLQDQAHKAGANKAYD